VARRCRVERRCTEMHRLLPWLILLSLASWDARGQATISGRGFISGTGSIQLYTLVSIQISPDPAPARVSAPFNTTIAIGGTVNLEAIGTFSDGTQQDLTATCTFTSSAPTKVGLGTVGDPQAVNGLAVGSSNISCTQAGITSNSLSITVVAVQITQSTIPPATVGSAYSTTFTASGGTSPYTYTCNPACGNITGIGLTLSSAGVLSGTPSVGSDASSPYPFTVRATDSLSVIGSASFGLTVLTGALGDNSYCTAGSAGSAGTPNFPVVGSDPNPTRCFYTPVSATPSPGATVNVVAGSDSGVSEMAAAIAGLACGQQIVIAAGISITGHWTLPALGCSDSQWITIKSSGVSNASFPGEGTTTTPCFSNVASMPGRPAYSLSLIHI